MRIFLLFTLLVSSEVFACFMPKQGYDWSTSELVEKSESIVLAKLESQIQHEYWLENRLVVIDVVKGPSIKEVLFETDNNSEHDGFDYFGHWTPWFWFQWSGRSEFPCCICGPDFTFIKGEVYLLFPDSFGALKSAEIIRSKQDRWYKYVIGLVNGT